MGIEIAVVADTIADSLTPLTATELQVNLTAAQLQLIRAALDGKAAHAFVTPEQRSAVREVCAQQPAGCEPEKSLIAFKIALVETANELEIPYGPPRTAMLARLVTVFIDELYDRERDRPRRPEVRGVPARGDRLNLEKDSPARL